MDSKGFKKAIEALLFAHGEKLDVSELSEILGIMPEELDRYVEEMNEDYYGEDRAIHIIRFGDSLQLATKPECYDVLKKLSTVKFPKLLSDAALEVLSIVAYRQPVTKTEIDSIRGVKSDKAIGNLLNKELIAESGVMDKPGKPILYSTTENFLKAYGFSSLDDLPVLDFVTENEVEMILENSEDIVD